jgi:hypothetical protein
MPDREAGGCLFLEENMSTLRFVTLGLAGTLAVLAISPSQAAPAIAGGSVVKAAPGVVTDVQWRRGHRGGRGAAVAAGVIGGAIAGAAIAGATSPGYYPGYYYGGPYGYYGDGYAYYGEPDGYYAGPPAVAYGPGYSEAPGAYAYAPRYVAPAPTGGCWVYTDRDRGFGYNRC